MAQEFFPQRVLASEERSGFYGRGEKDKPERAQRRLYVHALIRKPIRTENKCLSYCIQRSGEKCGLGCDRLVRAGRPRSREAIMP